MDEEEDLDVLFRFERVPHRGLSRMAYALQKLGVSLHLKKWTYYPSDQFPRVEIMSAGGTRFSLGVSRQPLVGFVSWASVHKMNDVNESSTIFRLSYQETSKIWSREFVPGVMSDPEFDRAAAEQFPSGTRVIVLENEDLVNAVMQQFVILYDLS